MADAAPSFDTSLTGPGAEGAVRMADTSLDDYRLALLGSLPSGMFAYAVWGKEHFGEKKRKDNSATDGTAEVMDVDLLSTESAETASAPSRPPPPPPVMTTRLPCVYADDRWRRCVDPRGDPKALLDRFIMRHAVTSKETVRYVVTAVKKDGTRWISPKESEETVAAARRERERDGDAHKFCALGGRFLMQDGRRESKRRRLERVAAAAVAEGDDGEEELLGQGVEEEGEPVGYVAHAEVPRMFLPGVGVTALKLAETALAVPSKPTPTEHEAVAQRALLVLRAIEAALAPKVVPPPSALSSSRPHAAAITMATTMPSVSGGGDTSGINNGWGTQLAASLPSTPSPSGGGGRGWGSARSARSEDANATGRCAWTVDVRETPFRGMPNVSGWGDAHVVLDIDLANLPGAAAPIHPGYPPGDAVALVSYSLTVPGPASVVVIEARRLVWVDLAGGCTAVLQDAIRRTPCGGETTRDVTMDDGNGYARRVALKVAVHDFTWAPLRSKENTQISTVSAASRHRLFNPPLAWQRSRRVAELVREVDYPNGASTVVDIGCGGGALLRALCNNPGRSRGGGGGEEGGGGGGPGLRHLVAIDTSLGALREAKDWGRRFAHFIARNGEGAADAEGGGTWSHVDGGGELEIVFGSILHPPPVIFMNPPDSPSRSGGSDGVVDVAVLMELIEHLPKSHLDPVTARVLGRAPGCIRPRMCIVTTPNADYNKKIDRALAATAEAEEAAATTTAGGFIAEGGRGGDRGGGGGGDDDDGIPPRLRHPDHKYELTEQEFKIWAKDAGSRYGYHVEIEYVGRVGVGGKVGREVIHADMVMDVDDEGGGGGGGEDPDVVHRRVNVSQVTGATQIAVFRRLEAPIPEAGGTETKEETLSRLRKAKISMYGEEEDVEVDEAVVAGGGKFQWKLSAEVTRLLRRSMEAHN